MGFAGGNDGVLGAIESGLLIGVLWGIFGAFAGALYGMWAGRGVSARRLKGLGAFVPPDSSLALAWADGSAQPASDGALGRDRVAAADPALQPGRPRRRAGGVRADDRAHSHWPAPRSTSGASSGRGTSRPIDLIAASTNSLNGALLARRPDHYKNWTVVGILLMALLMGLGGGITRDVLVGQVPARADQSGLHRPRTRLRRRRIPDGLQGRRAVPRGPLPVHDLVLAALVRDRRGPAGRRGGAPDRGRAHPCGRRPDRRALVRGRHQRRAAQAVRPGRVVRQPRRP